MKMLLPIIAITFLTACGPDPSGNETNSSSSNGTSPSSSSGQETKSYTVTTDNGTSCNVMIRRGGVTSHDFTLQCPIGTKIGCMRVYDNVKFILGTKSSYVSTTYGLVAADGYGDGTIYISEFNLIASVSLHETTCN